MSRLKSYAKVPETFDSLKKEVNEKASCSVIAVAAITKLPLEAARLALKKAGRKTGRGATNDQIEHALKLLGFDVVKLTIKQRLDIIKSYPGRAAGLSTITTHHPRRFPSAWAGKPDMLMFSVKHVAAFVDGEVVDWTIRHSSYVNELWTIKQVHKFAGIDSLRKG